MAGIMVSCALCGSPSVKLKQCAGCHQVHYCDASHQRQHWPQHRPLCRQAHSQKEQPKVTTTGPSTAGTVAPGQPQDLGGFKVFEWVPCQRTERHPATNLVILLHAQGDSARNFAVFGRKSELPQTCSLALQGPIELPAGLGYAWYPCCESDGELIRPMAEERRRVTGLDVARMKLLGVIQELVFAHRWPADRIFLVGYGQGGVLAIDTALACTRRLGAAVAISSGCFLEECMLSAGSVDVMAAQRNWRQRDVRVFVNHGLQDPDNPHAAVQAQVTTLSQWMASGALEFKVYDKGKEFISHSPVEMRDYFAFMGKQLYLMTTMEQLARSGEDSSIFALN